MRNLIAVCLGVTCLLLLLNLPVDAACHKSINAYGNQELKCDSLDEYPDHHPEDNFNVNPSAWNRGHQAGYDWAKNRGITDPADCSGKSRSFVEGCIRATE